MSKITSTEFEKWSKFFQEFTKKYVKSVAFKNFPDKEQEKAINVLVASELEAEKGNSLALFTFTILADSVFAELPAEIWIELSNELGLDSFITSFDYTKHIKKRLVEHHVARGYYSPNSPLSLEEWRNKKLKVGWGKGKKFETDHDYRYSLLGQMNEEDHQFIWRVYSYFLKMDEIFSEEGGKMTEETYQEKAFYLEDIIKTLEAAQTQLEQKKKVLPLLQLRWMITNNRELSTN